MRFMPAIGSILKSIRNFNQIHIEQWEVVEAQRTKYGEDFIQCSIEIAVRPIKREQCKCPKCIAEKGTSKKCPGYDYKRETPSRWRTVDCFGLPTFFVYRPQRITCSEHGVVTEYIPWADGTSRFTSEFNDLVTFLSCRASMSTIAELYDISWETVGECAKHTLARLEPDRSVRLEGVTHICVDETSIRKGHTYITVVFDMNKCRVIWIGDGAGDETYSKFINAMTEEQRSKIELIAGDGARWIDRGMVHFPNAKRAVDPFHVIGWVQESLDTVRKMVAAKASAELYRYQKQCMKEAQEAREAALKLELEIERTQAELCKMPKRGRESNRKKELKAYLAELLAAQQAQNGTSADTASEEETAEPAPVLTEEERAKYQSEYDAMPKRGKKSARKKELERLLGIKQKPAKASGNASKLTPEQEETINTLKKKAADIKGARFALFHNPENKTANLDAIVAAGWSNSATGVYTKELTGASGSIAAQAFTYTPQSGTYQGITVSKNSAAKSILAKYPAYYGFSATEINPANYNGELTRITAKLTQTADLNNTTGSAAHLYILTHSTATATQSGNNILNAPESVTLNGMSGYKMYVSTNSAAANGKFGDVALTINV